MQLFKIQVEDVCRSTSTELAYKWKNGVAVVRVTEDDIQIKMSSVNLTAEKRTELLAEATEWYNKHGDLL